MKEKTYYKVSQNGLEEIRITLDIESIGELLETKFFDSRYSLMSSVESIISNAIAERWVAENYNKVAERINPQIVANLAMAKARESFN